MKKILIAALSVFLIFEAYYKAYAGGTYQPQQFGFISFAMSTMTVTAVQTSTPSMVGMPVWCTNCTANGGAGTICISSTTNNVLSGGNDFILSTGTVCK